METITSCLQGSRDVWNKLKWSKNLKGQNYLSKDSSDMLDKAPRKTSIEVVKYCHPDENVIKVIDNEEQFKSGMVVMTEWGLGTIVKISEEIASVKIEGTDVDFPLISLNTMISIYLCIVTKDTTTWAEVKLPFDYLINDLKIKVARIINSHQSQVLLVHNGAKIEKNVNVFELGIYERDTFLAIIKDPQEFKIFRSLNNYRTAKNENSHHAIRLKVNQNIIITAIGLLKNYFSHVTYQIIVFEEEKNNSNLKLVFSDKQINVNCMSSKEDNLIHKHLITNLEIRKDVYYQIHQNVNKTDINQSICVKCNETIEDKLSGVLFNFSNCEIIGKENSTSTEEGMIPSIYYTVTSENS